MSVAGKDLQALQEEGYGLVEKALDLQAMQSGLAMAQVAHQGKQVISRVETDSGSTQHQSH